MLVTSGLIFYGIGGIGETMIIAEIQRLTLSEIFGFLRTMIHNAKITTDAMMINFFITFASNIVLKDFVVHRY